MCSASSCLWRTHASLTSAQHLFVQRAEAGQLQQASRDVGPESHSADAGFSYALAQRSDVQTRHLMLHLCRAAGHRTHDRRHHVSHFISEEFRMKVRLALNSVYMTTVSSGPVVWLAERHWSRFDPDVSLCISGGDFSLLLQQVVLFFAFIVILFVMHLLWLFSWLFKKNAKHFELPSRMKCDI